MKNMNNTYSEKTYSEKTYSLKIYNIIDNLYLSNYSNIKDCDMSDYYIVNCSKNLMQIHDNSIRLPIDDNSNRDNIDTFVSMTPSIVDIIEEKLKTQKVIVHCQAGQQRSAALVAAYLILKKGLTIDDSIILVKSRKPDAFFFKVNFKEGLDKVYTNMLVNSI